MHKKLMYWTMLANTVLIIVPFLILVFSDRMILPPLVFVLSGLLALAGLVLSVQGFVLKSSQMYRLMLYHSGVIFVSSVNLIKMSSFPMALNLWEVLIIGSLVHIFISFLLIYMGIKRYGRMMRKARFIAQNKKRRAKIVSTMRMR